MRSLHIVYTGKAIIQSPVVKDGKVTLKAGTDYTLSYKNNVNAGTATVTITGKGNYTGARSLTFKIALAKVAIPKAKTGLVYSGSSQTGVGATATYTVKTGAATKAGTYTAVLTLKDKKNYTWSDGKTEDKKVTWKIAPKSLAKFTISGIVNKTYTGKGIGQSPVVKDGKTTLKAGTDYTLTYKNNVKVGTATVTITGKGNYTGAISKTFKIVKAANPMAVSGKTATVKYANLKNKNQTIAAKNAFTVSKNQGAVTYAKASGNSNITVSKAGVITLKKGLKKGTYKITVKVTAAGNANYKAITKTVTVTIKVQ